MNNAVKLYTLSYARGGRDSSVGIVNRFGLDGPGIESQREARFDFFWPPIPSRGPPSTLSNGYGVFPGNEAARGVLMTAHNH